MLNKLKPVPRMLLILAVVGGVGFGLTKVDFSKFKKAEAPVVAEPAPTVVTPPTADQSAPAPTADAAPAPAPATQDAPSGLTPANSNNAGLDAAIRAGKK